MAYDRHDMTISFYGELLHSLRSQKHVSFVSDKTLHCLNMDPKRVANFVSKTEADAWVVGAASQEILNWFVEKEIPAFALYGAQTGIPIAGIAADHVPALKAAIHRLVQLGHHRIVSLSNRGQHGNGLRKAEEKFIEALEGNGIRTSSYHLPCWEDSERGFQACLESLFKHTPPTALVIEEATHFFTVIQFCARRSIAIPDQVSLICSEYASYFDFASPVISHVTWSEQSFARRIMRWAGNLQGGVLDRRQTRVQAKFIEGGTISSACSTAIR